MGKCLVTKLQTTVDNDELSELNIIILNINQPVFLGILKSSFVGVEKYEIVGDAQWADADGNSSETGGYFGVGTYKVKLYNKYNIKNIYMTATNSTSYGNNTAIECNLEDFRYAPIGSYGDMVQLASNSVYGDISIAAANWVKMTTLNLANTTLIYGDLAVMFKRLINNGRTTDLYLGQSHQARGLITFNGIAYSTICGYNQTLHLEDTTIQLLNSDNTVAASCLMDDIED